MHFNIISISIMQNDFEKNNKSLLEEAILSKNIRAICRYNLIRHLSQKLLIIRKNLDYSWFNFCNEFTRNFSLTKR